MARASAEEASPAGPGRPSGPVARLPAHGKVLATLGFVAVVVATPSGHWWALLGHAGLLAVVAALARLPARVWLAAVLVETPVLVFAGLLPWVAAGPRVGVLGVEVSESGLVGGLTLAAKASLGVVAATLLAASTGSRQLMVAFGRLRLPEVLVSIASFMLRYAAVVIDDVRRMRLARLARGGSGHAGGQLAAVAAGVGTVFVRSYERGERVHLAMLARGYTGRLPVTDPVDSPGPDRGGLIRCAALPVTALLILLGNVTLTR